MRKLLFWLLNPVRKFKKGDFMVVAFCIIAAGTFWFFNALNREYNTIINYPIKFLYNKQDICPISKLPSNIPMKVSGYGWRLLNRTINSHFSPYEYKVESINVNSPAINTNFIVSQLNDQLDGLQVTKIYNDSLNIIFEKIIDKEVVLYVNSSNISLAKNHKLASPILIEPAKITITGPNSTIKLISDTITIPIYKKNIDYSYSESLNINYLEKNQTKSSHSKIKVSFEVLKSEE